MGMGNKKADPIRPLQAAKRDAIWYSSQPNDEVGNPPKFHIVAADSQPACGQRGMILDDEGSGLCDPSEVPVRRRCNRHGCHEHWPILDQSK
jgi:hypothetical protein